MQYIVQRRNPLNRLEFLNEFDDFGEARNEVKRINRNADKIAYPGRQHAAYIFDTLNNRAIRPRGDSSIGYWCIWVGGSSYSISGPEYFPTKRSIKNELHERLNNQRRYPCVDESSYFECYIGGGQLVYDYPDFIIKFGPRGSAIQEIC